MGETKRGPAEKAKTAEMIERFRKGHRVEGES